MVRGGVRVGVGRGGPLVGQLCGVAADGSAGAGQVNGYNGYNGPSSPAAAGSRLCETLSGEGFTVILKWDSRPAERLDEGHRPERVHSELISEQVYIYTASASTELCGGWHRTLVAEDPMYSPPLLCGGGGTGTSRPRST